MTQKLYTVEPHGKGWAIYKSRDNQHHGLNLGQLTETDSEFAALVEQGLNAFHQPPVKPANELTGSMAYHTARGDYEVEQIKKRPRQNWPKFGELSPQEQAYWVAKTCLASTNAQHVQGAKPATSERPTIEFDTPAARQKVTSIYKRLFGATTGVFPGDHVKTMRIDDKWLCLRYNSFQEAAAAQTSLTDLSDYVHAQPNSVEQDPDEAHLKTIDDRDRYHDIADQLAHLIAEITGEDIGEHSSANCPWINAMHAANVFLGERKNSVHPDAFGPIDMVMHCPKCHMQHIDAPEDKLPPLEAAEYGWDNPPHRSHLCHACGHIWRPADVATNGVAAIKTKGKADSAIEPKAQPVGSSLREALGLLFRRASKGMAFSSELDDLLQATPTIAKVVLAAEPVHDSIAPVRDALRIRTTTVKFPHFGAMRRLIALTESKYSSAQLTPTSVPSHVEKALKAAIQYIEADTSHAHGRSRQLSDQMLLQQLHAALTTGEQAGGK